MSNKAEQLRHIYGGYDRSIDAPAGIRGRTGDVEDGDTLGNLLRDDSATAEDLLLASEDREPRIKFLKQFFALLKQTLSPDECKFIKLRFTKKKTDRQIAVWLGFKSVSGVFASIKDKLRAQERTIKRLAERSQWDGAALFVRQITTSVNELSRDENILAVKIPANASGYEALKRAVELANARENAPEERKIRRRFYMRGAYQAGVVLNSSEMDEVKREIRLSLHGLLGMIHAAYDIIEYKIEKSEALTVYGEEQAEEIPLTLDFLRDVAVGIRAAAKHVDEAGKINIDEIARKVADLIINNDYSEKTNVHRQDKRNGYGPRKDKEPAQTVALLPPPTARRKKSVNVIMSGVENAVMTAIN